ncbi:hypothetical protein SAMN05421759_1141, partial [Roseivivax lentus]
MTMAFSRFSAIGASRDAHGEDRSVAKSIDRARLFVLQACLLFCKALFLWLVLSVPAQAQYTNCPSPGAPTSVTDTLALNLTDNDCDYSTNVPVSDENEDFILIQNVDSAGNTNFFNFDGGDDARLLTFSVNGNPVSSGGSVTLDCSAGCSVTGTHGATAINFTYTYSGGTGTIGTPPPPEPEIAVSSSESGALTDGGTDAQGSEPAGMAKSVTYTVTNSGTAALTIAQAVSAAPSNVTVNSISAPGSLTVAPGGG